MTYNMDSCIKFVEDLNCLKSLYLIIKTLCSRLLKLKKQIIKVLQP